MLKQGQCIYLTKKEKEKKLIRNVKSVLMGGEERKLMSPRYVGMLKRRLEKIRDNGSEDTEMEFTVKISLWLLNLCPKAFITRGRKQSSSRAQRDLVNPEGQ